MRVILLKSVKGLGEVDEIKEVKRGYALNFLIPQNLAVLATPSEIKKLEQIKKLKEEEKKRKIEEAKELRKRLEGLEIEIKVKTDEKGTLFGSVSPKEVAEALKKQGIEIEEKQIEMESIKKIGEYVIKIKLAGEIESQVKIKVSG
jgi:large subunit ribosomal protein L9